MTRRLILMRHGKAEHASASGEDFDRALTPRGQRDAGLIAQALRCAGLAPELVLVSGAVRTRQTWETAAPAFPKAAIEVRPDLYLASAAQLAAALDKAWRDLGWVEGEEAEKDRVLMVVGHNPGLHEIAVRLLREGSAAPAVLARVQARFPTSAAAVFVIDAADRAAYDGLFLAEDHGGGASE